MAVAARRQQIYSLPRAGNKFRSCYSAQHPVSYPGLRDDPNSPALLDRNYSGKYLARSYDSTQTAVPIMLSCMTYTPWTGIT